MDDENTVTSKKRAAAPLIAAAVFAVGLCAIWLIELTGPRHLTSNLVASYLLLWTCVFLAARAPRRQVAARFLLSTLGLGLGLLWIEGMVLLGLVDARRLIGGRDPGLYKIFDEELGFRRRPSSQVTLIYHGNLARSFCVPRDPAARRYEVRWDHNGFRNRLDPDKADVAVLGDSYVEALEVPDGELMTTVLSQRLGVGVANLGLQGHGPWEMLVTLRRYAVPLRPKAVVWMFYAGNDFSDLRRNHRGQGVPRMEETELPAFSLRKAAEGSFTHGALKALWDVVCPTRPAVNQVSAVFRDRAGQPHVMYLDTGSTSASGPDLEQLRSILTEAFERTQPSRLLVVYVPIKLRVYRALVEHSATSAWASWPVDESLPSRFERMVTGISPEIGYLDLTPVFRNAARAGELVYLPDDSHWSPAGHRIAAEAIAARLSQRP